MSTELTHADNIKLVKFEIEEAKWIHEEVISPRLYKWVNRIIIDTAERNRYGFLGRLFHFCIEYFYVKMYLGVRIQRNRHVSHLGGRKGFRDGYKTTRLDSISTTVFLRKKEIIKRSFNIGIIY